MIYDVAQQKTSVESMKVTVPLMMIVVVACFVAKIIVQHPFHQAQTVVLKVSSFPNLGRNNRLVDMFIRDPRILFNDKLKIFGTYDKLEILNFRII